MGVKDEGRERNMRAIGMTGAVVVALALSGIGATAASAEEYPLTGLPELGRCVKVTLGTGHFNRSNCIGVDKDGNDGGFEWKPGPGEKGTFKIRLVSPTVETVGGGKFMCTVGFFTGEFTNGKDLKVSETLLEGCQNVRPNKSCFSNQVEKGKISSMQILTGEIGFIPNVKNESSPFVGLDLKAEPESVPLIMFNCGEGLESESIALEGSVIGKITKPNKMLAANGMSYTQTAGHQKPESFKGKPKDTLTETVTPISNPLEKTSEDAGLGAGGELAIGEAIEFKAKQH